MNQLSNTNQLINNDFSPTNCSMCGEERDDIKICRKCIGPNYKYKDQNKSCYKEPYIIGSVSSYKSSLLFRREGVVNILNFKL